MQDKAFTPGHGAPDLTKGKGWANLVGCLILPGLWMSCALYSSIFSGLFFKRGFHAFFTPAFQPSRVNTSVHHGP